MATAPGLGAWGLGASCPGPSMVSLVPLTRGPPALGLLGPGAGAGGAAGPGANAARSSRAAARTHTARIGSPGKRSLLLSIRGA